MNKLKGKKAAFVREYMIDMNQTQAAVRAGYSEKTAAQAASRLMKDPDVKAVLDEWKRELHNQRTAEADEVIEFYTAVMRGKKKDNIPLFVGDGVQKIKKTNPTLKDRLRAAEQLGKMYGLDKRESDGSIAEDKLADKLVEVFSNAEP